MTPLADDIVFLGDSIIAEGNWSRLFRHARCKNQGIGGDTSSGILQRLAPILTGHPRKIFLMVGINDLWDGVPVSTVVTNYRALLTRCSHDTPETEVILQSVLPMNKTWSSTPEKIPLVNAKVNALNDALRVLAAEFRSPFVDLHSLFLTEDYLDARYTYDGLHLNASAYEVWKNAIQHLVPLDS